VSSAADIPIEPLYKDPLLCVVPKGMERTGTGDAMEIDELRNREFVTQRESTDADIQNFLRENNLNVKSNYHVVDDLSTIAMVANDFGICLMPEMVMNDIPYEVDCYPLAKEAYRIIGIAALTPESLAPAVRTLYNHVLEQYQQEEFRK
jgi:DNA-binding transcriptional LysR family regulator